MNARIIPIRQGNALVNIYARDRLKNGNRLIEFKVADYTTGKRRFWSFSDEAKARTKAKEIAEALNGGRPETASLTEWQKKEYLEAEEMAKAVGLGLKESVMLFCQALKLIDDQARTPIAGSAVLRRPPQRQAALYTKAHQGCRR